MQVKNMVYDCFQFFNELDILKLRMQVMAPVVDKFVISEATETFAGSKKPLYYEEHKAEFAEFADKIIHVVVTDTPEGYTHDRDTFQKNAVGRGLKDCTDDDIIIFSDLDEIPNPVKVQEVIRKIKANEDHAQEKVFHMAQRLFYCYLNMEEVSGNLLAYCGEFDGIPAQEHKWLGTKICSYKVAKTMPLGELRWPKCKEFGVRVADGGWHFGYMGGSGEADVKKRVAEKVRSAAHQEYNNRAVLSQVDDKIRDGEDIFGRDAKFVQTKIDDTYPQYLRLHQQEYAHLIKQEESGSAIALRHMRRKCRNAYRTTLTACKRLVKKLLHISS
ncbi:MAG: glycosyl transferase GT17 family protein [Lachnospiraceae bacterium]|nr:glycosyl transferase GT17 family protein [Lachnospiraceae bacterium]